MTTSASDSPTLTVDETAALLGISRGLAFLAVRTGELPSIRIGRRILIPRQRLLALINNPGDTAHGRPANVSHAAGRPPA